MHSRELAELFFGKAHQDEFVLDMLISDPASPDEVIGFHAQQAVEKMLKAVLVLHAVRLGKIHEIAQLLALLRENHIPYPAEFEELDRLSPFAVDFRYEDLPSRPEPPFDRIWAADNVHRVKAWAEACLHDG